MKNGKKVISFSLFGNKDKYCLGALYNIELQEKIYPGWICRFYLDPDSVPGEIIQKIQDAGAEVVHRSSLFPKKPYFDGIFWRHEVMQDIAVERFIIRDADSRLSIREKICVDQWIESGKTLHIIRDHPHHGHRVMGGMWGGINKEMSDFDFHKKIKEFTEKYQSSKKRGRDQKFLAMYVYPLYKHSMIVHDDRHFFKDENPLPIKNKSDHFIGEIVEI